MNKWLATISVCVVLATSAAAWASGNLGSAIQAGADHVAGLQELNGKWGWEHVGPPTYNNITGPIATGMLSAYGQTGDVTHLNSAKAAGDSLVGLEADWVGTYNPMFLMKLYDATSDASYQTQAQTYYSELQAGTYTRNGTNYDTAGFITLVQEGRVGKWVNLRPWEFAPLTYAASVAGTTAQKDLFLQAMKDGINTLDNSDPGAVYSDTLGLAGGVMGLGWMNEDFDPTAGAFTAASSTADLADALAGLQNPDGSWYWHSNLGAPAADDKDAQTTAYAMLALLAVNDSGQYDSEIIAGRSYLLGQQNIDGGWLSYPGGSENVEVEGEILWALSDTAAVPVPAAVWTGLLLLGGLGGIATLRRRVRA